MPTSPGVTLTATLADTSGTVVQGKIVLTLNNFGSAPPRILGSYVIANEVYTGLANGSGFVTMNLYGNYQLAVQGSYYEIAVYGVDTAGNVSNAPNAVANFVFLSGGIFDLSSLIPFNGPFPTPFVPPVLGPARIIAYGNPLTSGDFVITGWGAGASIGSIRGSDMAHTFLITAGTSPSVSPTIQLNYHDGPWTFAPIIHALNCGGTGEQSTLGISTSTAQYTLTYQGFPIVTKTYLFNVQIIGVLN